MLEGQEQILTIVERMDLECDEGLDGDASLEWALQLRRKRRPQSLAAEAAMKQEAEYAMAEAAAEAEEVEAEQRTVNIKKLSDNIAAPKGLAELLASNTGSIGHGADQKVKKSKRDEASEKLAAITEGEVMFHDKTGFVEKQTEKGPFKKWLKRFAGVSESEFIYYHEEGEYKAGKTPCNRVSLVGARAVSDSKKGHFSIITHARTYHFKVATARECKDWISAIRRHVTMQVDESRFRGASVHSNYSQRAQPLGGAAMLGDLVVNRAKDVAEKHAKARDAAAEGARVPAEPLANKMLDAVKGADATGRARSISMDSLQSNASNKAPGVFSRLEPTGFIAVTNYLLSTKKIVVRDASQDYANGVVLLALLKMLSRKRVEVPHPEPKSLAHNVANVTMFFHRLQKHQVKLTTGMTAEDIVGGNVQLTCAVIWSMCKHFIIRPLSLEAPKSFSGGVRFLAAWAEATTTHAGLKIVKFNFQTFGDGMHFHGILHGAGLVAEMPDAAKAEENAKANVNAVLDATDKFEVPRLFSATELTKGRVPSKLLLLYAYWLWTAVSAADNSDDDE